MGPKDHVLDGGSDPPMERGKFLRQNGRPMLANTTEPSVCGGDAVLCQITLTTCFYYYVSIYYSACEMLT